MSFRFLFFASVASLLLLTGVAITSAHEGGYHDHPHGRQNSVSDQPTQSLDTPQVPNQTSLQENVSKKALPKIAEPFNAHEHLLQLSWDDDFFYVGSNGLPDHPMMIGIRSWQQQVPIPQKYIDKNAWRIPLRPTPAKNPQSTKNDFLRGAIAVAVNGVPIFNPLNNRGDDAFLHGELDEYGGHCGRADDYHYHLAPVHLEATTGKGQPIAYALDGYPIYGYQDETAADFAPLDSLGGQLDAAGNYHYHAQKIYPYLNGGFYGEVTKRDGQVHPQPHAEPIRPALQPIRGATITRFSKTGNRFELEYEIAKQKATVAYVVENDGDIRFTFEGPSKDTPVATPRTESYRSRLGKPFLPQTDFQANATPSAKVSFSESFDSPPPKPKNGWSLLVPGSTLALLFVIAIAIWRRSSQTSS